MPTIRKRGNNYQIRVSAGYDMLGKQIEKTMTYKPALGMTEKQIEKELNRQATLFEDKIKLGFSANEQQTFSQYAEYVLGVKTRAGVKHSTITRYKSLLVRINPVIGHIKLSDLRPQHINNLYELLSKDGQNKATGGKLSSKTIIEHHRLISTVLAQAEKEMLIVYNSASKATPPKAERKQVNYFQTDDIINIREALEVEPLKWKTATHLLLISGARRGEIMGLKWDKIDFTNNQITIDNNLLYSKDRGIYEDSTKNTTSDRTIKIPIETMQLLKEYRKWYLGLRFANGDRWQNTDFLFVQDNGLPMHPDSITDWLGKFSNKHKLPHINPHAFRHTMASVLYFNGVDSISISGRLGHAKVSTTTDIYGHIIKQADERASECIADVMLRNNKIG